SSSAPAGSTAPRFDPSRPDAATLELLAKIPDPGPLEGALDQADRGALAHALSMLSDKQKANLRECPDINEHIKPLLLAATKPDDKEALYELCCRGRSFRALHTLHPASLAGTRRLAIWAAQALAHRSSITGRPPVDAAEADRLADLAHVLDQSALEASASALAASLEPTPERLSRATSTATMVLDVSAARRHLTALKAGDLSKLSPLTLPALENEIAWAEELGRLGAERVRKEDASRAAELAVRLGRYDLVPSILEGVSTEDDLRATAARIAAQIQGNYCLGMEWSREPLEVCARAWLQNVERQDHVAHLERALRGGKGRSPWALEAYLGITRILPLTYWFLAGGYNSTEDLLAGLRGHHEGIGRALAVEGIPPLHRDAVSLFSDVLLQGATTAVQASTSGWRIDEPTSRRFLARATEILERHPGELLAQQAALSVAMLFFRSMDTGPVIRKIPKNPLLAPTWARTAAFLGLLRGQSELREEGLRQLDDSPPWLAPEHVARNKLLALEVRAALEPSPDLLEAILATTSPEKADALDHLQRLTDKVGALFRLGRRGEAERLLEEQLPRIHPDPADSSTTDLLGVLQTMTAGMMATSPDPVEQRRGMDRLRDRLLVPEQGLSEAVRLYRAMLLKELLDQGRAHCISSEVTCRAAVKVLRERTAKERKEMEARVIPEQRRLMERGAVLAGSNMRMSFSYNPATGVRLALEYTPRLLLAISPGEMRSGKKGR
ncbi:MAG: hypothetical protein RMJ98_14720, partial [Myxococcales bacterium]|nr:hypothetical protein [Polyangiaceae bacterium]MDW8250546.1 hypothetical protein [Myxococcales bacterium]